MLHRPKKRSCPFCSSSTLVKVRRQPAGEMKGNRPSNTSTRPSAIQTVSLSKGYFFAGGALPLAPLPRNVLKNSELAGSSTITSAFLLKVAL
jgi:hypothetical protein